ncbi:hypothetical protein DDW44_00005 [Streptomyces tirandamycinicus]|uniref:Uncharacterized protein n=1 Tax=Streptomyces tirandamycinicus TaxID=2174846 RepID=A0A2S1SLR7_9ACTN|nr:hypothetical protein DDW44_00005 [Streptomyces tirandamycinicus]
MKRPSACVPRRRRTSKPRARVSMPTRCSWPCRTPGPARPRRMPRSASSSPTAGSSTAPAPTGWRPCRRPAA